MSRDELIGLARSAYADRRWRTAFDALQEAESLAPLEPEDLDRLATCAHLLYRVEVHHAAHELAHRRRLEAGDVAGAALSAFWTGMQRMVDGDTAVGSGWLQRSARLATSAEPPADRVLGYLALSRTFQAAAAGDHDGALAAADDAIATAERHHDADLAALALHRKGLLLIGGGHAADGCALLDEAMVAVTAGETSPVVTGIVYCGVVAGCWRVYDIDRAQQWTDALSAWCDAQDELGSFVGECRVRRAELQQLHGDLDGARRELVGMEDDVDVRFAALAVYVRGEIDRVQGRLDDAETEFATAARLGREPQPGLALLRLRRGSTQAAAAMMRRTLAEVRGAVRRMTVLAAAVEVFAAAGDDEAATRAAAELTELAARNGSDVARAMAAHARAHVAVATGRPADAVAPARESLETWLRLDAPYPAARARVVLARACRALGDVESAGRELTTAREVLTRLGARTDLDALDRGSRHALTAREVEVLRLVATGATNRAVAETLSLSERTVDRHVGNIFTKLGVSSRAGATARAAEWQLL